MFQVVRNDLARVKADAIVIPANPPAEIGGGTELSIYEAAGRERLLAARQKIGELQPGEVAATEAFDLPAKILIHAVSAVWSGGDGDETKILRDCYRKSLELAREKNCRSIAFPLLGTGTNRIPKEKSLLAAVATIEKFLATNDMDVTLVIFGQKTFEFAADFFDGIESVTDEQSEREILQREYSERRRRPENLPREERQQITLPKNFFAEYTDEKILREVLSVWGQNFNVELFKLVDNFCYANKISKKIFYTRANVDKKVFYDAINLQKNIRPKKKILFAIILTLKLSIVDALKLLARAEYFLSSSNETDLTVGNFLRKKIFDVDAVNDELCEKNLDLIGSN
ncbi:MAG: macro domain-containing protein [Selenomonadaceae bacterium]|nr:macro domain-containing protein [Selenomonadaceae bacterium]